jgi:protein-disulfide isomerase
MSDSNRLIEGNPAARVRLKIYEDLQCGDCTRLHQWIDEGLLPVYGSRVAIEYYDYPLPKHSWAKAAAIAAKHFERSAIDKAGAFRREVVGNIPQVTAATLETWIRIFTRFHNLNGDEAVAALRDPALAAAVDCDIGSGVDDGVRKTPTVMLGPIAFIEKFHFEDLAAMIDAALAREDAQ